MTIEEALERINNMLIYFNQLDANKEEKKDIKAFKLAIKALEKQIAKKPIIKPYFDAVCCPICNETIDSLSIGNHRDKYCHNCGQKILWEGEKE